MVVQNNFIYKKLKPQQFIKYLFIRPLKMNTLSQGLAGLPLGLAGLPQGLASLPNELVLIIFDNILLITNKRQFLRTCVLYNKITTQSMKNFENNYKIKHFDKTNAYCMEKFTMELCHDLYFDMIPKSYFVKKNKIIVKALTAFLQMDNENIKLLQLVKDSSCDLSHFSYHAAFFGNLDVLKWAKENGCNLNDYVFINAACNGHLNILNWAKENSCSWNYDTSIYAAKNGQLESLKWAYENGYNILELHICKYAASSGNLEVLKWARTIGCEWDKYTCSFAAEYGHLHILKWARENGCDWDASTCTLAAYSGHLNILKWARKNGCNWNYDAFIHAKLRGHTKCLEWLKENGCPE